MARNVKHGLTHLAGVVVRSTLISGTVVVAASVGCGGDNLEGSRNTSETPAAGAMGTAVGGGGAAATAAGNAGTDAGGATSSTGPTAAGGTPPSGGAGVAGSATGGAPTSGGAAAGGAPAGGATAGGATAGGATASAGSSGAEPVAGAAMGGTPAGGSAGAQAAGGSAPMAGAGGDMPQAGMGGQMDDGDCMTPPPAPALVGWASEGGGTTGGGNATPQVVTDAQAFANAISGNDPAVIYVNGSLSSNGRFTFGSNKTVVGVCGAELRGSLEIKNVQNIIIRNIRMVGNNCSDSPNNCSAGDDAIGVRTADHLWFDHMEILDGSDGNLDMTHNSDYITVSWTKFYYSTARTDPEQGASGHRFSNLIGASDSDSGEYRITFHHDWWADNVDQRMPRTRFGDIHVFNNLFTSSGNSYCTNAGISTHVLVENNIYRGVNRPLAPDANGDMRAEGNVFDNTTGSTSDNGGSGFTPPYDYQLDPTDGLDQVLMAEVGPHD